MIHYVIDQRHILRECEYKIKNTFYDLLKMLFINVINQKSGITQHHNLEEYKCKNKK